MAWVEQTPLLWVPGERCSYHHLSWSFIVGGLVSRATAAAARRSSKKLLKRTDGRHISDIVSRELAAKIGRPGELHLGRVPPSMWSAIASLEPPPVRDGGLAVWARGHGEPISLPWRLLGCLECCMFSYIGNSLLWRDSCFPYAHTAAHYY